MDILTTFETINYLDDCYQQALHLALQHSDKCIGELQTQAKLLDNVNAYVMYNQKDLAHGTLRAIEHRLNSSQIFNSPILNQTMRIAMIFIKCTLIKLKY